MGKHLLRMSRRCWGRASAVCAVAVHRIWQSCQQVLRLWSKLAIQACQGKSPTSCIATGSVRWSWWQSSCLQGHAQQITLRPSAVLTKRLLHFHLTLPLAHDLAWCNCTTPTLAQTEFLLTCNVFATITQVQQFWCLAEEIVLQARVHDLCQSLHFT